MTTLFRAIDNASELDLLEEYVDLNQVIGRRTTDHILQGLIRACFLIELVKTPKIESTKFEVRWAKRLGNDDPRFAQFDECLTIFEQAMVELEQHLQDGKNAELLQQFRGTKQVAYEIPFDYKQRITDGRIHQPGNLGWYFDDLPKKLVTLRALLLDQSINPYVSVFRAAYSKINVKCYLTDRVLTGTHKTNREKRWETHPLSVHFALRRICQEIELTLINQICHFENFPDDLTTILDNEGVLLPIDKPYRCPITYDPLSFDEFKKEILEPTHGKASFQVGHLNPLKAINDDDQSGHSAQNISWISADGNRIQGHLSLQETRDMIRRINENYSRFGVS